MSSDRELETSAAARRGAVVVDQEKRGTLIVTGPDRATWLNAIVTCDVGSLRSGEGRYGLALTKQGKVVSDLSVVASDDAIFVSVAPGRGAALCEFLDQMLIMEDAELEDASDGYGWFALHGPRATSIASEIAAERNGVAGSVDWTGLGGAALVVERAKLEAVRARFEEHTDVALATDDDWLKLRLERGVPELGVDYTNDDNPHQAGLERRAVSWDKGCYLGQEVVCMVDMRGKVRRRLVSVTFDTPEAPPRDAAVVVAERDEPVGLVTSSAVSDRLGRGVALARVLTNYSEPGTRVTAGGVGGQVVELADG